MTPETKNLIKRKSVCALLGIVCGLICCAMAATKVEGLWGSTLMWVILWNRLLIGIFVFVVGVFNYHAILKIRLFPWLRGAAMGAIVSIGPAVASLMGPEGYQPQAVWGFIIMGAIFGLLIDVIATKVAGDGKALVGEWTR